MAHSLSLYKALFFPVSSLQLFHNILPQSLAEMLDLHLCIVAVLYNTFSSSFQHQVYEPSKDPQVCCGSCKNVSCTFTNKNGTTDLFAVRKETSTCILFAFLWAVIIQPIYAGWEFLGGELYTLWLYGNISGSRDTCLWGCLPTFQWHRMCSGQVSWIQYMKYLHMN